MLIDRIGTWVGIKVIRSAQHRGTFLNLYIQAEEEFIEGRYERRTQR